MSAVVVLPIMSTVALSPSIAVTFAGTARHMENFPFKETKTKNTSNKIPEG
jgi:hypothetical protein